MCNCFPDSFLTDYCSTSEVHTFQNSNVETTNNYREEPSENMFKKKFTKLSIKITVHPGDQHTQDEIISSRKRCLERHLRHGAYKIQTQNHLEISYFVGNTETIPFMFSPAIYWIFGWAGMSLLYRLFIYIYVGHVRYKIRKRVFKLDVPNTPERERQAAVPQSQDTGLPSSVVPFPNLVLNTEESRPPSPPPPYVTVSTPPTQPQDYDAVCTQFDNGYEMTRFS